MLHPNYSHDEAAIDSLIDMGFKIQEVNNLSEAIDFLNDNRLKESEKPQLQSNHFESNIFNPLANPNNEQLNIEPLIDDNSRDMFQLVLDDLKRRLSSSTPEIKEKKTYEVADILNLYWPEYIKTHKLPSHECNVIFKIMNCATATFGYRADVCSECGHEEINYNSCGDRHCPKCQGQKRQAWIQKELSRLLDVPYYHIVFTLPDAFYPMSLFNKKIIYEILFETSSETLLAFGKDPKWLGAEMGFTGILHTWGQNLLSHLHIHYIVPGDEHHFLSLKYLLLSFHRQ